MEIFWIKLRLSPNQIGFYTLNRFLEVLIFEQANENKNFVHFMRISVPSSGPTNYQGIETIHKTEEKNNNEKD